jgi:MFS family permease
MHPVVSLWRAERRARWFFVAHLQGALGAGAGYIALLLLAYDRIGSAWGATAVLLADVLPAMLLGPLLGGVIDRTSRLGAAIVADVIRALAFAGLVLVDGTSAMVLFALLAGLGTACFRPATYALLPGLVDRSRLAAANGLFNAMRETGFLLGPVLAAVLLALASPAAVLTVNAVTFGLSALLLTRLRGHVRVSAADRGDDGAPGGLRAVLAERGVPLLIATSGLVTLTAATINVAELVLAHDDLHAGATGFALLVCAYGFGLVGGALFAGRDTREAQPHLHLHLRRRRACALGLLAVGLLACALAPTLWVALGSFAVTGAANGLFTTANRLLLQRTIPEGVHGRAFGLVDSLDAWGFALAVTAGGALTTALGGRATFALAAAAVALIAALNIKGRSLYVRNAAEPGLVGAAPKIKGLSL